MKVTVLNEYFDKELNKKIKVGAVLDLDDNRIEELMDAGIDAKEYIEESEDEISNEDLIKSFKEDRSIVDDLKSDSLKILCEAFGIDYKNVADAKEALKIATIS